MNTIDFSGRKARRLRLSLAAVLLSSLGACGGGDNGTAGVTTDPAVNTPAQSPSWLTDTGVTASQCYEAGSNVLVSCTSAGALALNNAQDGMRGRDVNSSSATDGKLGFSYSTVGSYAKTECVKDNVTGLIWEGKTADGGLRDFNKTYTFYDNTALAQSRIGSAYVNPTQAQIDAATNAVGYVNAVNAAGLCGASDWRLPTADELQSLVDYGVAYPGPTLDTTWFPNTQGKSFWSSSPNVGGASYAWYVGFDYGDVYGSGRGSSLPVRLVRAGQ